MRIQTIPAPGPPRDRDPTTGAVELPTNAAGDQAVRCGHISPPSWLGLTPHRVPMALSEMRTRTCLDRLPCSSSLLACRAKLEPTSAGPLDAKSTNDARTQPKNDRGGMPRRHAQGLRRHPRVSRAGGAAPHVRRDGAPHRHQAPARAWREGRRLYGGRLRARLRQARHLHGAGDRRAQPRRRLARRLARAFAGDRHDRRARAEDQVPQGLPGDRRRAGVRAGHQVQRHRRRRRALSRHGAAGVPRGDLRHARAGAPAVPRQRGPGRRRGSRDGAAVRAAIRAGAAVPSGARRRQRAGGARGVCRMPSGR